MRLSLYLCAWTCMCVCVFKIKYIQIIHTHTHIPFTLKCILWTIQVFLPFSHSIPQKISLFFCITFRSKERGTLGITFITITCWCCCLVAKVVSDSFATLWTVDGQVPLSMGFPRQEYWSEMPYLLQGTFLTQRSNPHLLHWQADSLLLSHQGRSTIA